MLNFYSTGNEVAIITDGAATGLFYVLSLWGMQLLINAYPTRVGMLLYTTIAATLLGLLTTAIGTLVLEWWLLSDNTLYRMQISATMPVRYTIGVMLHMGIGIWYAWRRQYKH